MNELTFASMGTTVRLLAPAGAPLETVRDGIERLAARLTRFTQPTSSARTGHPASELSVLNADPRPVVPASPLLRHAVAAALLGARRTGGLADPTLLGALEDAGYASSRVGVEPASLRDALRAAPPRRPAQPGGRWREVRVDHASGTIARPPGVRLDLGGSAKGLAADWAARKLAGSFAVDCGGDVRLAAPTTSGVRGTDETLRVTDGAVATSGLDRRIWQRPDGGYAPPPARSVDRRAGVDRADRRHGARSYRARSGGAGKSRAAVRPGAGARGVGRARRGPRPRRRPRRAGRPAAGGADPADGRGGRGMTRDPMDYGWWLASRASGLSRWR